MNLNLRNNAGWAIGEAVCSGVVLFFLYKIVVAALGVKALGVWSLVLATTSLGRLADLGTSAGLGRFVAASKALNNSESALRDVETAIVTNLLFFTGLALAIAVPAYYGLALVMETDSLEQGRALLPFSLVSFVLMSVVGATNGAIIGQHRSDQKSIITLAALAVQLVVAAFLVPDHGLPALAWAQIAQYLTLISLGWLLFLKNHFGRWTLRLPCRWRKDSFRKLLGFGMKLQAVSITGIIYDPLVKFLMSSYGGLDILGYFEMAQRLVLQARQLVVMPNQALVPTFAHLKETVPDSIASLYSKATALSIGFGALLLGSAALLSPVISYLWIGHLEKIFIILTAILACGWFCNLAAAPAYLLGVGTGYMRGNVIGSCVSLGVLALLGYMSGQLIGGYGIALSTALAQLSAAYLCLLMNCRTAKVAMFPTFADFAAIPATFLQAVKRS